MNHTPSAPGQAVPRHASAAAAQRLAAVLDALCALLAVHLLGRLFIASFLLPLRAGLVEAGHRLPPATAKTAPAPPFRAAASRLICEALAGPARARRTRVIAPAPAHPCARPCANAAAPPGRPPPTCLRWRPPWREDRARKALPAHSHFVTI